MADEADRAQILEEAEREASVKAASKGLAIGQPGYCLQCGDYFIRLVLGTCACCREQAEKDAAIRVSRRFVGD